MLSNADITRAGFVGHYVSLACGNLVTSWQKAYMDDGSRRHWSAYKEVLAVGRRKEMPESGLEIPFLT